MTQNNFTTFKREKERKRERETDRERGERGERVEREYQKRLKKATVG